VFQNYALFPHLDVRRNLAFGLEMRGVSRDEMAQWVDKVLSMVQLGTLAGRYPRQLSGGQQQRVALARALVIEPRLLLLDEPLANLDAVLREEMRVFIRDLQRRIGITTLYVTHDQAEAMLMSDRVAVMLDGRLQQFDVPEAIYLRPARVEVARFIGRSNLIKGQIQQVLDNSLPYPLHQVQTPIGLVEACFHHDLPAGKNVYVTLRPEAIHFCQNGAYAARVERSYFLGSTVGRQRRQRGHGQRGGKQGAGRAEDQHGKPREGRVSEPVRRAHTPTKGKRNYHKILSATHAALQNQRGLRSAGCSE